MIALHFGAKNAKIKEPRADEMRLQFVSVILFGMLSNVAMGAVQWWNMDTVCQIDNTPCYTGISAGIDSSLETGWDVSGMCRGKKYICADALTNSDEAIAMERADISRGTGISSDFDTNVYVSGENCYGARKTRDGGTSALVNGRYARVWCNGVLGNPTAQLSNGEITTGAEPTCKTLAMDGYAAVLNGKCYGKYYDLEKYVIECDDEKPSLVILNGADYNPVGRSGVTMSSANAVFNTMIKSASSQRTKYFPK